MDFSLYLCKPREASRLDPVRGSSQSAENDKDSSVPSDEDVPSYGDRGTKVPAVVPAEAMLGREGLPRLHEAGQSAPPSNRVRGIRRQCPPPAAAVPLRTRCSHVQSAVDVRWR